VLLSNAAAGRVSASKIAPTIVAILNLMKAPLTVDLAGHQRPGARVLVRAAVRINFLKTKGLIDVDRQKPSPSISTYTKALA
jgi:hypothetical protein